MNRYLNFKFKNRNALFLSRVSILEIFFFYIYSPFTHFIFLHLHSSIRLRLLLLVVLFKFGGKYIKMNDHINLNNEFISSDILLAKTAEFSNPVRPPRIKKHRISSISENNELQTVDLPLTNLEQKTISNRLNSFLKEFPHTAKVKLKLRFSYLV